MKTNAFTQNDFVHTKHSLQRACQRGISDLAMVLLLKHGTVIRKQGCLFYYTTKNQLKYLDPDIAERIKNLVAVLTPDKELITCYKNEKALKKIKHKTKYLIR